MTFDQACRLCLVRGYVARLSLPGIHIWKNHQILMKDRIPNELQVGDDWETHDPEGEETSIVG